MSEINVALMSADVPALFAEQDLTIMDFKAQCIRWCDFIKIFYHCRNDFKIKKDLYCALLTYITFNSQIEDNDDPAAGEMSSNWGRKCLPFDLKDFVMDEWKGQLMEKGNCPIDPSSEMKLQKYLMKMNTLAGFSRLCKVKINALTREELTSSIVRSVTNPRCDRVVLTVGVQISPIANDNLSPIILNFRYEIGDLGHYASGSPEILRYPKLLCPCNHECSSKIQCYDSCKCTPPIHRHPCGNCDSAESEPAASPEPEPASDPDIEGESAPEPDENPEPNPEPDLDTSAA